MKPTFHLFPLGLASLTFLGVNLLYPSSSYAQTTSFFCGISPEGVHTTYGKTERGDVPIIRWVSSYFAKSGYTPRQRCLEVSNRFQDYYQKGTSNTLPLAFRTVNLWFVPVRVALAAIAYSLPSNQGVMRPVSFNGSMTLPMG